MKHELNYLYDLKKDDVKDYYFVDYKFNKYNILINAREETWIREGWLSSSDLTYLTATMEWGHVKDYRIHSYRDLIEPVDKNGLTEQDCELQEITFEPVRQKIEHIFDDRYLITRGILERVKGGNNNIIRKQNVLTNKDYLLVQRKGVIENRGDIYETDFNNQPVSGMSTDPKKELEKIDIVSSKDISDSFTHSAFLSIDNDIKDKVSEIMSEKGISTYDTTRVLEELLDRGVEAAYADYEDGHEFEDWRYKTYDSIDERRKELVKWISKINKKEAA